MGLREHRHHEGAAQGDGPVARLEPRARVLRSVLLSPPAEDVPRLLAGGPRLPQGSVGQLGSCRQYRAGQRAGDRGQGLAHRRAGRAAHAHPVEPQDHQVRRRAPEPPRHARALAGEGAPDAGQLDRQEPRRARLLAAHRCFRGRSRQARDLHHAARHALWRFVRGAVARASAGHRAGRERSGPAALRCREPQDRHRRGRGRDRGEGRLQAAAARQTSVDAGQDHAGLCRQLRADGIRHGRHLRLPRPRRARPRIRDQVRPADHSGGDARGRRPQELQRRPGTVRRGRRDHQLGFPERTVRRGRQGSGDRTPGGAGRRPGHDAIPPARLAGVAPALLGLPRSRRSIARRAASCRCRKRTCRSNCPRMSISTSRATRSIAIRPGSTWPARSAAAPRSARPTRSTPSSIRAGTSTGSPRRSSRRRRSTARRTITGCRSINISAASSTRSCTCSIRASGPAPCAKCR